MDFVLIWPSLSLVSSYSWGGVPKKRDSCQDELSPECRIDKTYMGSRSIWPIWNPTEGIVCHGCLKRGRILKILIKFLFFAFGGKNDSQLKEGGGLGTIFLPPCVDWVWTLGGLIEISWASCPFSFSDTQHFRFLRTWVFKFICLFLGKFFLPS